MWHEHHQFKKIHLSEQLTAYVTKAKYRLSGGMNGRKQTMTHAIICVQQILQIHIDGFINVHTLMCVCDKSFIRGLISASMLSFL